MFKRNLLILIDGDFVGGAETNYRFILPALRERGWEGIFLCPDDTNLRRYFSALGQEIETRTGFRSYRPFTVEGRVSLPNLLQVLFAVRANRKSVLSQIAELHPVAVISNSMVSHLLNAALPASKEYRRVVHLHDIVNRRRAGGLYGRGLDWFSRRADAILTISDAVIATLSPAAREKAVKLYNPIGKVPARTRKRGLPLRVGMFARYTLWKGHQDLIRIASACSELPVEFVSYGNVSGNDGDYLDGLKKEVGRLAHPEKVKLNGFAPDPLQEMANCDYVLHLSTSPEPFGRVLIEANACGVPILAYRGGGVDELFENLSLAGQRFQNGDWASIASEIGKSIASLKDEHGQMQIPPALESLSADHYAEEFLKVCLGRASALESKND